MSDDAVFHVTRGLRMLLHSQLVQSSPTAVVTLLPPGDTLPEVSGVNLYLYRVIESPFLKNQPWAGDRVTAPKPQPALSLQLSYLLTPLGKKPADDTADEGDDSHKMLGVAMRTFHENPVLNNAHVTGFDADTVLPDFLLNSFEQVKMTLVPTSLEELSKIWATINKPYRLSVAYEASLVQIAPTPPVAAGGGIVLSTGVRVTTLDPPRLTGLTSVSGALARIVGTVLTPNELRIDGFGMSFPGQTPVARFGGQVVSIKTAPAPTDQSITVSLPVNPEAGPQADVTVTLNGRKSDPAVFAITPWIDSATPVRTAIEAGSPKLTLKGIGFSAAPQAVRFELTSVASPSSPPAPLLVTVSTFDAGGTDTQAVVSIPALTNGTYNVRLVLADAANSASNARTLEVIPRLDATITVTTAVLNGKTVHRLTMAGARLNGQDIRVFIDGVMYQAPANTNAVQLVFTAGKQLLSGAHRVAVQVDGHRSHEVDLVI